MKKDFKNNNIVVSLAAYFLGLFCSGVALFSRYEYKFNANEITFLWVGELLVVFYLLIRYWTYSSSADYFLDRSIAPIPTITICIYIFSLLLKFASIKNPYVFPIVYVISVAIIIYFIYKRDLDRANIQAKIESSNIWREKDTKKQIAAFISLITKRSGDKKEKSKLEYLVPFAPAMGIILNRYFNNLGYYFLLLFMLFFLSLFVYGLMTQLMHFVIVRRYLTDHKNK